MEEDADTHNHQNDIGGSAADMVCIPCKITTAEIHINTLLPNTEQEHDDCAPIAQST